MIPKSGYRFSEEIMLKSGRLARITIRRSRDRGGRRTAGLSILVHAVMPMLVTGIHVLVFSPEDVDGRNKSGHDDF